MWNALKRFFLLPSFIMRSVEVWEELISKLDVSIKKQQIIIGLLERENVSMSKLSEAVAALRAQVEMNTSIEQSAILLIQGIAAQLAELSGDPAAVEALAAQLKSSADALAAAVAANTGSIQPTPEPL
jgi:hypothetical protein